MKFNRLIIAIGCLLLSYSAKATDNDSLAVIKAANDFVTAFNNFDWKNFRNSFDDDATIFYPTWEIPKRISGRKDFETSWTSLFPEFLDSNNKEKLSINPRDIHVQLYGNTAVLTFHLGDGKNYQGRRTIVWTQKKGIWKIVHLHASVLEREED